MEMGNVSEDLYVYHLPFHPSLPVSPSPCMCTVALMLDGEGAEGRGQAGHMIRIGHLRWGP